MAILQQLAWRMAGASKIGAYDPENAISQSGRTRTRCNPTMLQAAVDGPFFPE